MIRVAVVDDHPAPRAGIAQAVSGDPEIRVVGEGGNGPEAWALLARGGIDVLLLDVNMPGFDSEREVPRMRVRYPGVKILIVTVESDPDRVHTLVKAGVAGYVVKDEDLARYIEAVHDVAEGRAFFSKSILGAAVSGGRALPVLTRREKQVLTLIARGDTSELAARELGIVERTVNFHIENIFRKLDVNSRAAAAAKALQLGLISGWKDDRA